MNLRQTDAEFRLHVQQVHALQSSMAKHPPNPFAAALGIGVIVLLIWLIFMAAPIIGRLMSLVR